MATDDLRRRGYRRRVIGTRLCSKSACGRPAAATLTYVYSDSTVVVGQLAAQAEPHSYDLCAPHAERFTAPRGWDVVQVYVELAEPEVTGDDLDALAMAVRSAARRSEPVAPEPVETSAPVRGHLRVVPTE